MAKVINKGGSKSINNFGLINVYGSQVIGRQSVGGDGVAGVVLIQRQLDAIQARLNSEAASSCAGLERALRAVDEIRLELVSESPKKGVLERSLDAIAGISSVASLVGQIRALLPGVF